MLLGQDEFAVHGVPVPLLAIIWQMPVLHVRPDAHVLPAQHAWFALPHPGIPPELLDEVVPELLPELPLELPLLLVPPLLEPAPELLLAEPPLEDDDASPPAPASLPAPPPELEQLAAMGIESTTASAPHCQCFIACPPPSAFHCEQQTSPLGQSVLVVHGQFADEHCCVARSQHWSARQSAFDLQHATQLLFWQHLPAPHCASVQQAVPEMHCPLQHCSLLPHWALLVHAHAPHCAVVWLQHWLATQSLLPRQPLTHDPFLQTVPEAQSASVQHWPLVHCALQHFPPEPHCASVVHGHDDVVHWFVAVSQHWLARQSACVWQQLLHEPLSQHSVEPPQSESVQQAAVVHAPLQHFLPVPHSASEVHWQFWVPHSLVVVLQHWLATQSPLLRQPLTHAPFVQTLPEGQSASTQQAPCTHLSLQHFWPPGHCVSDMHVQLCVPQV